MEKQKSQWQQIVELSDIIRAKYKKIKYNKLSSEKNVNEIFKPVVEPLKKLVDISNYKIKQDNEKLKQKNKKIERENKSFKN